MDRRLFLKLTGLVAAASALDALPVSAAPLPDTVTATPRMTVAAATSAPTVTRVSIREPGLYRISGQVRLDAPLVEISGISNSQTISWSGATEDQPPVASFTTFEQVHGVAPEIRVTGGQIQSLSIVPIVFE